MVFGATAPRQGSCRRLLGEWEVGRIEIFIFVNDAQLEFVSFRSASPLQGVFERGVRRSRAENAEFLMFFPRPPRDFRVLRVLPSPPLCWNISTLQISLSPPLPEAEALTSVRRDRIALNARRAFPGGFQIPAR